MKEFWTAERTIYPSLFRVLIGLILLVDLVFLAPSSGLLFNREINAFLPKSGVMGILVEKSDIFISVYGLVLIAFIFGIGKNITSFFVFCFHFSMMEMTLPLLTWGDFILKFSLLYFVFADSFRHFSICRSKDRFSFLSRLAVWSIILNIFLVYLNNAYFKIIDKDWQGGIAVYYSFSQYPGFKDGFWYSVLSHKILSKIITYFIVLQQLTFVPLVIWRKSRYWAIGLSLIIHLIMMFQFGLWKFELTVILLYGFLLNDEEWNRILPMQIKRKGFSIFQKQKAA